MSAAYEEIAVHDTPLGQLLLRRRRLPGRERDIYEIKLDGDLLMSSWLDESERELARRALARVPFDAFEVLVGGLGLGATAAEALTDDRIERLTVVELLTEVIAFHEERLVPLASKLAADARAHVLQGDFFELAGGSDKIPGQPAAGYGAILVDIDHAPDARLGSAPTAFYDAARLAHAVARLRPGGVFALWAAGRPHDEVVDLLATQLVDVDTHEIVVFNPMADAEQVDTLYVAVRSQSDRD